MGWGSPFRGSRLHHFRITVVRFALPALFYAGAYLLLPTVHPPSGYALLAAHAVAT